MSETIIAGGRKPQVRGATRASFTKTRQERFLAELAATCNVKLAARRAGVSDNTVYRHRRQTAAFRAGWAEALKEAYANLELAMLDRALNGTVKTVRRAGKIVDKTHEYPNAIALTLLRLHRDGYLRRGSELELKSFTGATPGDGGYAVPREIDAMIDRTLTAISPIRAIANVVRVGSSGYRKLVTSGGTPSGWVAETAARAETDTPDFHEIAPPMGELYANPAASQAMLDDAAFDVEQWLASEIATEFARAEGAAFVSGGRRLRPCCRPPMRMRWAICRRSGRRSRGSPRMPGCGCGSRWASPGGG